MKFYQKKALSISIQTYGFAERYLPLLMLSAIAAMLFSGNLHAADDGVDYLANVKPGVTKTFGHGSTFEWLAYIGEAVMCIWRYLSTQNVAWFVGMPVVMAFTYAFLN